MRVFNFDVRMHTYVCMCVRVDHDINCMHRQGHPSASPSAATTTRRLGRHFGRVRLATRRCAHCGTSARQSRPRCRRTPHLRQGTSSPVAEVRPITARIRVCTNINCKNPLASVERVHFPSACIAIARHCAHTAACRCRTCSLLAARCRDMFAHNRRPAEPFAHRLSLRHETALLALTLVTTRCDAARADATALGQTRSGSPATPWPAGRQPGTGCTMRGSEMPSARCCL